ncbi:hypothetical protein ACIRL0_38310 [Streptomyces sp. NPDC102365]|uniref:hypothetical protein n=1 Tax=Streptomyces sp. NPDC102365 TaxID=3366162 RepID=UPI0038117FDE
MHPALHVGEFAVGPLSEVPVRKYCKSYLLGELRRFPGWSAGVRPEERELTDDTTVFLCDEFTVMISPVGVDKDKRLFTEDTPEWREFCETTLKFRIPEDLAFAYVESEQN